MRSSFLLVLATGPLVACAADSKAPPETPVFEVQSSDLTLNPGDEITKCFYFHTTNTERANIYKWVSDMTPGSHHLILFTNFGSQAADGTIDDCNFASDALPVPIYASQIPHEELDFPTDEGHVQLAQSVQPNTAGIIQMHYLNSTDNVLTVHVGLSAYALEVNKPFTRTDLLVAYNDDIAIPPHATGYTVSATCPTDANQIDSLKGARFWQMTTHSHKQTKQVHVRDAGTMVLETDDWEHPTQQRWNAPSFYEFGSGQITWDCVYDNTGANADNTITSGQSAKTNEMCMTGGYYFPIIGALGVNGCFMSNGSCHCPEL
jgi:hypothetical protein